MLNLTSKLHTFLLICEKFGTTKMLILNLIEEQLTDFIGQEPFRVRVSISFVTTFFNILSNLISHEALACNDKEVLGKLPPGWLPPGKFLPRKIPTQDNPHLGKFPSWITATWTIPTRKTPIQDNSHPDNY